ncbi:MAG: glycine cleavage system protein GcvH [Actinomycetia bacterium]|nr:glycine cleavage system protein GcvH [Actinomycetes bacterium]
MNNPAELQYTKEHEWVRLDGEIVRVGLTDFAQDALGDVVYVSLPETGGEISAGDSCGEVESTKSVSDVYAPVSGTVVARNEVLEDQPDLINADPYGAGWLFDIQLDGVLTGLLTADEYGNHTANL